MEKAIAALCKINLKNKNKYIIGLGTLIILLLAYRYIAPFGASVKYQFTDKNKQVEQIKGLEPADEFRNNSNSLLKVPTQVIRKNIVTFNVRPLYKNIDKVGVYLRFKGTPKEIKLGIKGSEKQKYTYKPLYHSLINELPFQKEGELSFWQKDQSFKSISEFISNFPTSKLVGYYMFDPAQISVLADTKQNQGPQIVIDKTLRGTHTFFVKTTQAPFILKVEKQDANLYPGEDRLTIKIEKGEQILAEKEIGDDGIVTNGGLQLAAQPVQVQIDEASGGIYKITLKDESQGSDIRIKKIEVNQAGLVFVPPVFVLDTNPTTLLTNSNNISLQTYHQEGLQTVKLNNQFDLPVNKLSTKFDFFLGAYVPKQPATGSNGFYTLTIPQNDLVIRGDGSFFFDKNSFFDIKLSNFVDVNTLKSIDSIDYIVTTYQPVTKKDDWYEAFVVFTPKDFKLEGDNLFFSLESPELNSYGGEINVDSLEVSVNKP